MRGRFLAIPNKGCKVPVCQTPVEAKFCCIYNYHVTDLFFKALEKPARLPGQPAPSQQSEIKPPGAEKSQADAKSENGLVLSGVERDTAPSIQKPVGVFFELRFNKNKEK